MESSPSRGDVGNGDVNEKQRMNINMREENLNVPARNVMSLVFKHVSM